MKWRVRDIQQALRLREQHDLTYRAIAVVLAEYHHLPVTADAVRVQLRRHGAASKPNRATSGLRRGRAKAAA